MSYSSTDNPQSTFAAKVKAALPPGYLVVADVAKKYGVETANVHAWAKAGRVERVRVHKVWAYNCEEVAACAADYHEATSRAKSLKKVAKQAETLLVWAETAYEFSTGQIKDARTFAAIVAGQMGESRTIYTRKRWNGRVTDTPLEVIPVPRMEARR